MNEKRFEFYSDEDLIGVLDSVTGRTFNSFEIVDLLNDQQELIEELHISDHMGWKRAEHFEKELKTKKIYIKRLEYKVQKFKEMNSEQQATIDKLDQENADLLGARIRTQEEWEKCTDKLKEKILKQQATIRKLQDLCGESDGENAKLRIENEQLRKELDNFKPVMFQDVRKGTVILYSKGD